MVGLEANSLAKTTRKDLQLLHKHDALRCKIEEDTSEQPNFERMHQPHKLTSFDGVFSYDFATPISLPTMPAPSEALIHEALASENCRLATRFSGSVCDATDSRDVVHVDDVCSGRVDQRKLSAACFDTDPTSRAVPGSRTWLNLHCHEIQSVGRIKAHELKLDEMEPHGTRHLRESYGTQMHWIGVTQKTMPRCSYWQGSTQPRILSAGAKISSTGMRPGGFQLPQSLRVDSGLVADLRTASIHITEYDQYCVYCSSQCDTATCHAYTPSSRAADSGNLEFMSLMRERDLKHTDVDAIVSMYSAAGIAHEVTCGVLRGARCSMSACSITSMVSSESLHIVCRLTN